MNNNEFDKVKIVCVSNNQNTLNQAICSNSYVNNYEMIIYDNTQENIGIAKRYNSFIESKINAESDFWVVFCHHDFEFDEEPYSKLKNLNKEFIYGPIGVANHYNFGRLIKNFLFEKIRIKQSFKIDLSALFNRDRKFLAIKEYEPGKGVLKSDLTGEITQLIENNQRIKKGKKIEEPKIVSNLDCCCVIIHSSLISKYNLRFDENLDWHLDVEDFCIEANSKYKIKTKAIQLECTHYSLGILNEDFYEKLNYVKNKHSLKYLNTTCIDS